MKPVLGGGHSMREYRMENDQYPGNPCYLDEVMLERFERFCRIAEKNGLKLIVGLITGWMSGRLFVPAALYEKNIFTDPTALFFQQLFIKGFVGRMKGQKQSVRGILEMNATVWIRRISVRRHIVGRLSS